MNNGSKKKQRLYVLKSLKILQELSNDVKGFRFASVEDRNIDSGSKMMKY